jgi:hypothetical protein
MPTSAYGSSCDGFVGCHFDLVDRDLVGRLADEIREMEADSAGLARMTVSKAD